MSKKHLKLSVDQEISFLQEMDTAIGKDIDELETRVEVVEERTQPWNWSWLPPTLWGAWAVALVFMAGRASFTIFGIGASKAKQDTEQVVVHSLKSDVQCFDRGNGTPNCYQTVTPDPYGSLVVQTQGTGHFTCPAGKYEWIYADEHFCLPFGGNAVR